MSWLMKLARPDIRDLRAYEHAIWEPGLTRLHANELPWRASGDETVWGLNHYPEPQPRALVARLAQLYHVAPDALLVSRGSDEAIDLLVRAFCRAGEDEVVLCPPTFGMYAAAARIQSARVVSVPLRAAEGFTLDTEALLRQCTDRVKLVFLCSPNNPTGNLLSEGSLLQVIEALAGRAIVVVDEAYLEFSERRSLTALISSHPQLAVLRTLSKAYGLAGARVGALIADPEVIALLRKVIAPYAICQTTLEAVMPLLGGSHLRTLARSVQEIRSERTRLFNALGQLPEVTQVFPSDANFLLARFADPAAALSRARHAKLLVRDVRGYLGLEDAVRITVGTPAQNDALLDALR